MLQLKFVKIPLRAMNLQISLQGQRQGISDFELAIDECAPGCDSCSQSQRFNYKSVTITLPWTTLEPFPTNTDVMKFEWTYGIYMEMEIDLDTHIPISAKIRFWLQNYNTSTGNFIVINIRISENNRDFITIWIRSFCNHIQILQVADFVHTNPKIIIRADITLTQYDAAEGPPILGIPDLQLFIIVSEKYVDTDSQGLPNEGCQLDISQFIEGFVFTLLRRMNYIELEQRYSQTCGDAIQNEQCDNGNLTPYDGCYQCQYSCPLYSENCVKGKCIECQQPQLLVNGYCLIQWNYTDDILRQQFLGCMNWVFINQFVFHF